MSTLSDRLARVEKFISALKLRSYVAKSADEGLRYNHTDVRRDDHELAAAVRGENMLAKAQGALRTDDDILAAAAKNPAITPVEMGVISSHLSQGDYTSARRLVVDASERRTLAKAADPITEAMTAVEQSQPDTDAAELREAVVQLQATISSIVSRLDRLEARRPAKPAGGRTVAKAQHQPAKKRRSMDDLLQMLAYVDSPTQTGALSAMLQSGDLEQIRAAERALVSAKRNHEAEKVRAERRSWR